MFQVLKNFWAEEEGAAAIEYALIAALIAMAIIGGATLLGGGIGNFFTNLGNAVSGISTASV